MCEKLFGKRLYAGGNTTATSTADLLQQLQSVSAGSRIEIVMQMHVEQRELELAHGLQSALEILGREHFVEQLARQRLPAIHVLGHACQHVPLPAEVLHELAGQLHRIPLDAVDARDAAMLHAREQMMQPVAELVEQGR